MRKAVLVLIPLLPLVTSCGSNLFGKKKSKNKIEYFVHGDPIRMIEGSTQDKQSFLAESDLERFNGFHAVSSVAFIEVEPKEASVPFAEVEAANDTGAEDEAIQKIFALIPYAFSKVDDTYYEYRPTVDPEHNYKLGFRVTDGILELVDIDGEAVTTQHYSLKKNSSAFSFLVSLQHPRAGRVLLSIGFADSTQVNELTRSPEGYSYLIDTVELRWPGPITLDACGNFSDKQKETLNISAERWLSDPLKTDEGLNTQVTFRIVSDYPPFSDVNSQCIFLINDFRLEASDSYYTAGVTIPTINSASKQMVDSDVFLFMDHYPVASQFNGNPSTVLMHELGHFFGLGHEFRNDGKGRPLHPSIMAYSLATSYITEWDFAAVRALYGGYLTAGTGQ